MKLGRSGTIAYINASAGGIKRRIGTSPIDDAMRCAMRAAAPGSPIRSRPVSPIRRRSAGSERMRSTPATASSRPPGKYGERIAEQTALPPPVPSHLVPAVALERNDRHAGRRGRFVCRTRLTEHECDAAKHGSERAVPSAHDLAPVARQDERNRFVALRAHLPAGALGEAGKAFPAQPARDRQHGPERRDVARQARR